MSAAAIEVRPASHSDLPAIALVRVASWRAAYAGLVPDHALAEVGAPDRLDAWVARMATSSETSTLVALADGVPVGFSAYGAERSELAPAVEGRGEVYALYVHPDHWGVGIGYALMRASADALRARGYGAMSLWVLEGNATGIAFYLRQGFTATGEVTPSTIDALPEAHYARAL